MLLTSHVFEFEPTWEPLERLRDLAVQRPDIEAPEVESYMYMGKVVSHEGSVTIHLFKHVLTRHYLNIDDTGHAYRYVDTGEADFTAACYEPLDDLASAIDHAQGEAKWMRSGRWLGPDHDAA
jgi:hypothetical protein